MSTTQVIEAAKSLMKSRMVKFDSASGNFMSTDVVPFHCMQLYVHGCNNLLYWNHARVRLSDTFYVKLCYSCSNTYILSTCFHAGSRGKPLLHSLRKRWNVNHNPILNPMLRVLQSYSASSILHWKLYITICYCCWELLFFRYNERLRPDMSYEELFDLVWSQSSKFFLQ